MIRLRLAAGVLLAVWAGFWAFFAYAQFPPAAIAVGVGVVLFVVPLLAWRWREPGGALLVLEGLGLLGFVTRFLGRGDWTAFLVLTLVLPPLAAGMLLLATDASHRKPSGESSA
jgi:peptidoglycan/LPS O-acetylase OafA/YrhL